MKEYRPIWGWPYSVASDGTIKNDRTNQIIKPQMSNAGYYRVRLWKDGVSKNYSVHRIVAEAFVPNPLLKPEVNHIDGNKENNNAENLEWVTDVENKRHCREVLGKVYRNPDMSAAYRVLMKKVRCIDTGETFESITAAAKSLGVLQSALSKSLISKNGVCKGRKFEYV